jgi:hypothetical protein
MQRKRISIRIEHTEVTLSITEVSPRELDGRGTTPGQTLPPRRCPVCGSPWLPDLRAVLGALRLTAAQLKLAASEGKLHLFCSPENEVWVCERSIQEMRGDFLSSQFPK